MWVWFKDRLLAPIIIAVVVGGFAYWAGVAAGIKNSVVASYFPEGSIIYTKNKGECPQGFDLVGIGLVLGDVNAKLNFDKISPQTSAKLNDAWGYWAPFVCMASGK
jgi:hypothetical protein